MLEQGKKAKVFGSDGLDSGDFHPSGAYVSSFARDIHGLPGDASIIAGYNKKYGTKWSTFGPPAYTAAKVIATARQGGVLGRPCEPAREMLRQIRTTTSRSRSSGSRSRSTSTGTSPAAKFYVYQIQKDGSDKLVS